jgi:hypothetical protein
LSLSTHIFELHKLELSFTCFRIFGTENLLNFSARTRRSIAQVSSITRSSNANWSSHITSLQKGIRHQVILLFFLIHIHSMIMMIRTLVPYHVHSLKAGTMLILQGVMMNASTPGAREIVNETHAHERV